SGLVGLLGSKGPNGAWVRNLLGDHTGVGEISAALDGARGVSVAATEPEGPLGPRGERTGRVEEVGALGTPGAGPVELGKKREGLAPTPPEEVELPPPGQPTVDPEALARFINARRGAIASCYERQLLRNPHLSGRVLLRFSLSPRGRATGIDFEDDSLGSEPVLSCIRSMFASWSFPFNPPADVAFPYVFTPAGR
ncbi:MAG: AgmX/PglI C-terminal domain-containing protein, partial [Myxococcaceae bacterium]